MRFTSLFLILAVFTFVLGGCKYEENPAGPGTNTTSHVGVIAGFHGDGDARFRQRNRDPRSRESSFR